VSSNTEIITVLDLQNLIGELRSLARALLSSERNPQSLTPTALAITAIRRAKLVDQNWDDVRWENRAHFFSILNLAMRHALLDRARRAKARGRDKIVSLPWDDNVFANLASEADKRPDRMIALDEALARLQEMDARLAEVIHQFYFAGYSVPEMARFSGVSEKTVDRELQRARTILKKCMEKLMQPT
jgi:RNA polymerase sigma factor (TIGR02999 family)